MSRLAGYGYAAGDERIWVRVDVDGKTSIVVTGPDNDVRQTAEGEMNARDAQRLVMDADSIMRTVQPRPDGELSVAVEVNGQEQWVNISEYDLPFSGLQFTLAMKNTGQGLLRTDVYDSSRARGGPQQSEMTPLKFLGWTGAFFLSYIFASILATVGRVLGASIGIWGYAIMNTVGMVMTTGAFYTVGRKFGEEYRGRAIIWLPAILGTLPFGLLYYVALKGPFGVWAIIGMAVMPLFARWGEKTAY